VWIGTICSHGETIMAEFTDHFAELTRIDNQRYHLVIRDGFRHIDETINGVQLLGMLTKETLINTREEVIDAQEMLYHLETQPAGDKVVIGVKERIAHG
jgi:hypothetical protein